MMVMMVSIGGIVLISRRQTKINLDFVRFCLHNWLLLLVNHITTLLGGWAPVLTIHKHIILAVCCGAVLMCVHSLQRSLLLGCLSLVLLAGLFAHRMHLLILATWACHTFAVLRFVDRLHFL